MTGRGRWIVWLCTPGRAEEMLGDLAELHARRRRDRGRLAAWSRTALDVASVCLLRSRAWSWSGSQRLQASALLSLPLLLALGLALSPAPTRVIQAHDPAGRFTLRMRGDRLLGASVDGVALPSRRLEQRGRRLILRGADGGRDLVLRVTPGHGIRWTARRPAAAGGGGAAAAAASPRADPARREPPAIDLEQARRELAEIAAASAAEGGRRWGEPLYGPLLLVDRASRQVVANVPDAGGRLARRGDLYAGTLPPEENVANTALEWSGVTWSMLIWPLPDEVHARRRLVFHELFHRLQRRWGWALGDPANPQLATRDGRIWTRLEWRALAAALLHHGAARRAAVADALTFRARRHRLFPGAADEERALELNEGLAEYTGLAMSGLPPDVLPDRAAVGLAQREGAESLSRSFAYASGPAYGLLLDATGDAWRRNLSPTTDLARLLRSRMRLPPPDPASAEGRWDAYDGARIVAEESRLAERRDAELARLRAALVEGPVLRLPADPELRYSFDPDDATPLPAAGTAYGSARVTASWGVLTVAGGGVLLARGEEGVTGVVVPLDHPVDAPPTAGQGWSVELAPGWRIEPGPRPGDWRVRPPSVSAPDPPR